METATLLRAVLALVLLSLGGLATASLVAPGASLALRLGWAFGLGGGWLTLALAAASGLGLPLAAALAAPLLPLLLWAGERAARPGCQDVYPKTVPLRRPRDWALGALLVAILIPAFALTLGTSWPGWDGMAIWHFKGRMFYVDGGISLAALTDPAKDYSHPEYPLHLPLLLTGLARAMGRWDDALLLAVGPLAYGSLLLLVYGTARLVTRRWVAMVVVAGIAPLPGLAGYLTFSYADLPFAMYAAGTLAGLVTWLVRGDRGALALAALAAGLGAWTKQEGWVLLATHWVVAWLWAPRWGRARAPLVASLVLALLVAVPWQVFRIAVDIPTEPFALQGGERLRRLPTVLSAMASKLGALDRWGTLWVAVVACSLPWRRAVPRSPLPGFQATLLWTTMAACAAIYAASPRNLDWHVSASLDRLLLHVLPAAACIVAVRLETLAGPDERRETPADS